MKKKPKVTEKVFVDPDKFTYLWILKLESLLKEYLRGIGAGLKLDMLKMMHEKNYMNDSENM